MLTLQLLYSVTFTVSVSNLLYKKEGLFILTIQSIEKQESLFFTKHRCDFLLPSIIGRKRNHKLSLNCFHYTFFMIDAENTLRVHTKTFMTSNFVFKVHICHAKMWILLQITYLSTIYAIALLPALEIKIKNLLKQYDIITLHKLIID